MESIGDDKSLLDLPTSHSDDAVEVEDLPLSSFLPLDSSPSPVKPILKLCLACGSAVTDIKLENPEQCDFLSLPENEIFSSFCELLHIKLSGKFVWWDFNPDSNSSKIFCADCVRELSLLQDLKRRLAELEKDLENGIETFKGKCCGAEPKFKEANLYLSDKRYKQIRRQIKLANSVQDNDSEVNARRSSLRKRSAPANTPDLDFLDIKFTETIKDDSNVDRYPDSDIPPVKSEHVTDEEYEPDLFFGDSIESISESGDSFTSAPPEKIPKRKNSPKKTLSEESPNRKPVRKTRTRSKPKANKTTTSGGSKKKRGSKSKKETTSAITPKSKKESPKNKKKQRTSKWILLSDDGAGFSSSEEEHPTKRKSKRKKIDKNYDPDENEDNEDDVDLEDVKSERVRFDPETGHHLFLNIAYKKLDSGKFKCLECKDKEIIIFKYTIRKHTLRAHSKAYSCKECGHCEGSNGDLQKHIRDYHLDGGRRFTDCPICGKPCSNIRGRLKRHITTHYSEQEKQEAIARGEKVLTWADYHTKRDYQCSDCGKQFESRWYLKQHIIAKHPTPELDEDAKSQKELCQKCGKLFLKYYIKTHQVRCQDGTGADSNRKFICTMCDKRFYRYVELKRHKMSVHDKNFPHQCTQCPKGFSSERQLRAHMNRHKGIRPFACTHCSNAFFTKGNLDRHVDIYHTDGSNPKRKTYSKKVTDEINNQRSNPNHNHPNTSTAACYGLGGIGPGTGILPGGENKPDRKYTPTNANALEASLPKLQEDFMKNSHFMLSSMASSSGSHVHPHSQDMSDVVLFSDFTNPSN